MPSRALLDCANSELTLDKFDFEDHSAATFKIVLRIEKDTVIAPHSVLAVALFTDLPLETPCHDHLRDRIGSDIFVIFVRIKTRVSNRAS